jgi:hypothetical protein
MRVGGFGSVFLHAMAQIETACHFLGATEERILNVPCAFIARYDNGIELIDVAR